VVVRYGYGVTAAYLSSMAKSAKAVRKPTRTVHEKASGAGRATGRGAAHGAPSGAGRAPGHATADGVVVGAVRALPPGRYLLAVSGGRDSMVLLDAFTTGRTGDIVTVATFDHGTGPAATRAAEFVRREADRLALPVTVGTRPRRATPDGDAAKIQASEEEWRRARWEFLFARAREMGATIVTAHTLDDQVETVCMRIFRQAGARGIAAMFAPSPVARPLIRVRRTAVAEYARAKHVRFVDDPSNASMRFLRNRIRAELLPALERVRPGFGAELTEIAERAAEWRMIVAELVDELGATTIEAKPGSDDEGSLSVAIPAPALIGMPREALGVVWPELVARAGGTLDWRGLARLNGEAGILKPGSEIPVSGGLTVGRTPTSFVVRNQGVAEPLY